MFWRWVCLLCLNIWRVQVLAGPISSPPASATQELRVNENVINPDQQYPFHPLLSYSKLNQYDLNNGPRRNNTLAQHTNEHLEYHDAGTKRRLPAIKTTRIRRTPTGFSARGFHEEAFDRDFGHFAPMKRRPEADASGFYGDTFSGGFGEFETMKRKYNGPSYQYRDRIEYLDPRILPLASLLQQAAKRRPENSGFHDDAFNSDFGEFNPMRK